jgi:hypothetical protein
MMQARAGYVMRAIIPVLLFPVAAVALGGCCVYKDVDMNSADIRKRVSLFGGQVSERIAESPFSHEVRRLHIDTSEVRNWKRMSVSTLFHSTIEQYNIAVVDLNFLLELLDLLRPSDEERRSTVQKALSNLEAGELEQTAHLIGDIAERLRATSGLPPTPEQHRLKSYNRGVKM